MEFKDDIGKPWQYEDGEYTVTRTAAYSPPGCHPVGCGVKLYVNKDGVVEKVEGDENHPITQGRLCVRCLALTDTMYNPSRVLYPMKRDPKDRGKNKWERITYDEALDLIAEKVAEVKKEYGAEAITVLGGTGRQGGPMCGSYAHRMLGTPNACYTQSGYACYAPRVAGTSYVLGAPYPEMDYAGGLPGRYDDPMYEIPEVAVVWGKEPLPSNPDGLFGHALIDVMKRGTKLISVDPRVNWLATRAACHLQLRPGTDTALAMAMLHVIISEDLYDHDFVDRFCYGFDELAERVAEMPPEKAAEICGIDVEDIYKAARMYANAKNATLLWGLATDQKANGVQMGHAILALMAITGNIDIPGGQILVDAHDGIAEAVVGGYGWAELGPELQSKIIGLQEYPAYVGIILNAQADMMLEAMETGEPYPIKMAYISSTNLLAGTCAAQPKRWHDAIAGLDFNFCTDVWMTPTAMACADVFVPLAAYPEHQAVVLNHYAGSPNVIGSVNKAVDVGETHSDFEFMYDLGRRCMPEAFSMYNNFDEFVEDFRLGNTVKVEELKKEVTRQRNVSYRKYENGHLRPDMIPGFNTPTGRVELYSTMFQKFGEDPLPYYEEPQYSPISTPELMEEYPFVLTTGARTYCYFHSEGKQVPYLREMNPDPLVEINTEDAKGLGVKDGDWVELENQFGKIVMKAKVTPIVKRGVVHAQHGFWFPEKDAEEPVLYDVWRSNINSLIPHFHVGKLGFGAPFKCAICSVRKTDGNWDTDMEEIWEKFNIQHTDAKDAEEVA